MKESRIAISLFLLIAVALGIAYYLFESEIERQKRIGDEGQRVLDVTDRVVQTNKTLEEIEIQVFFCVPGCMAPGEGFLKAEKRMVFQTGEPVLNARQIIAELIQGAEDEEPTVFREDARVRQIYILEDKTAIVDLSRETADYLAGGIQLELCAIHSITRSLLENVAEIERVKFLVGGKEEATLAGHVSIGKPFM